MIKHYIFITSSYSIGSRVVFDYCDEELQAKKVQQLTKYIFEKCGSNAPFSTHFLQTDSKRWKSVINIDRFFKNVIVVNTIEEFVKIMLEDKELNGLDVAKYILSKIPCTHLKLEKLVYMCYADYLCNENEKLFTDKIYSYKLGPIVETVYQKFRRNGLNILRFAKTEDDEKIYSREEKNASARSRILSSGDGVKKITSIDNTLKRYGQLSAGTLVTLTHRHFTPWEKTGSGKIVNEEISDDIIKTYHKNEIIKDY